MSNTSNTSRESTVVVKIKFRFSIRTTAVERVNRCRIEPILPQNCDRSTAVLWPRNGAVSIKIAVLRPLVTPYNGRILRASIDRVRVFSISSSALL